MHEVQVVRLHDQKSYTVEITHRRDDGSCYWTEYRNRYFNDKHSANEYARKRAKQLPDSLTYLYD